MLTFILRGLGGVAFCCIGFAMLRWPRKFWYATQGWWSFENPEDIRLSDGYLLWNAFGGAAVIFAGIVVILLALFGVK
jgi:hypothetical protein